MAEIGREWPRVDGSGRVIKAIISLFTLISFVENLNANNKPNNNVIRYVLIIRYIVRLIVR